MNNESIVLLVGLIFTSIGQIGTLAMIYARIRERLAILETQVANLIVNSNRHGEK